MPPNNLQCVYKLFDDMAAKLSIAETPYDIWGKGKFRDIIHNTPPAQFRLIHRRRAGASKPLISGASTWKHFHSHDFRRRRAKLRE
ncbi:hypothetical protein BaRGS_00013293 [Batillaria attramentaria]|uniref:Uncharacterized protein n=1 Tax=Batillaria attramentaria TaxID=370345 RepID=A0ABD0L8C3_9CAEN